MLETVVSVLFANNARAQCTMNKKISIIVNTALKIFVVAR